MRARARGIRRRRAEDSGPPLSCSWEELLADGVHAQRQAPAIVILCASGRVNRVNDGGFLASGANCVLYDREGGQTLAEFIVVYDSSLGGP